MEYTLGAMKVQYLYLPFFKFGVEIWTMLITSLLESSVKMDCILLVQVSWSEITATTKPPMLVTCQIKMWDSDAGFGL